MSVVEQNKEWIESIWSKIEKKAKRVAVKSRDKIPYTTVNGEHDNKAVTSPAWWTNGFWGGMMWLLYNATKDEDYKITAERCELLLDEALKNYKSLHHDVGFMWHITSGANYRLTGNEASYNKNLYIAATLFSRYNPDGGYIRAWNSEPAANYSIIDCLLNIPLLYWASEEIGDDRFKRIAMNHCDMALRDHIREDGSTNHIVDHDHLTGECVRVLGGQGYAADSCWSRGLAWAVYGTILSYVHTGKKEYLEAAKKTANYFISNVALYDYLPPSDFKAPLEPVYYDSTAGVCTACGLIEIAKYVSEAESEMYLDAAIKILKAAEEHFCDFSEEEDSILQKGTVSYPLREEMMANVHIPLIYGDFFLVEAICKLRGDDFLIW